LNEGGKSYFPPCFDADTGKVQLLFGYCDDRPKLEEVDVSDFIGSGNQNNLVPLPSLQIRRDSDLKKQQYTNSNARRS
jgi:hypothetical protein